MVSLEPKSLEESLCWQQEAGSLKVLELRGLEENLPSSYWA